MICFDGASLEGKAPPTPPTLFFLYTPPPPPRSTLPTLFLLYSSSSSAFNPLTSLSYPPFSSLFLFLFLGNRIVYCDGCNAAVHQACYGVAEIPEGDFYCDRCRAVQDMANGQNQNEDDMGLGVDEEPFDPDNARDAIKCCLCPCYHGGIKPTTDGRWVHLCCAVWATATISSSAPSLITGSEGRGEGRGGGEGGVNILDLTEMAPVDVENLPVQPYREVITLALHDRPNMTNTSSLPSSQSPPPPHPPPHLNPPNPLLLMTD